MAILDEDDFNKEAEKGNRKYMTMAERGEDYLVIRGEAEKDGLEGRELSMVMDMVDRILLKKETTKVFAGNKTISIIMGAIITIGGLALLAYGYYVSGGVHLFNIIIIAIGISALFKGLFGK